MELKLNAQQVEIIKKFPSKLSSIQGRRLIVIGDSGLDEYVFGKVRRISPEAPVPVVEVLDHKSDLRLGLSTNVAQNITALGGICTLISVIGDDPAAEDLKKLLTKAKVGIDSLVKDDSRPTTRKLRVMSGQHHVVRVDYEHQRFLSNEIEKKVLERVGDQVGQSDGVIVQDYAKGVLSESCIQSVVKLAKAKKKIIFVDPHRSTPVSYYRGADLMTPNYDEALALSGLRFDDLRQASDSLKEVGDTLRKAIQSDKMVITRGKDGMSLYEGNRFAQIPTFAQKVFDVAGAGDTVIAALSMAFASGFSLEESCLLANEAAGVVVAKVGCVPCPYSELVDSVSKHIETLA
jgi:D-glycero-beta-D-manno-heptose-7-phosphate kinase